MVNVRWELYVLHKAVSYAHQAPFSRPGGTPGAEAPLSQCLLPRVGKSNPRRSESLVMGVAGCTKLTLVSYCQLFGTRRLEAVPFSLNPELIRERFLKKEQQVQKGESNDAPQDCS